jgi:hypothetical protein
MSEETGVGRCEMDLNIKICVRVSLNCNIFLFIHCNLHGSVRAV